MFRTHPFRAGVTALFVCLAAGLVVSAQTGDPAAKRGYLGVQVRGAEPGTNGVVVGDVTPNSPGAKSGLKTGDRIVKLGEEPVRDVGMFLQAIAAKKPGDNLKLGVLREGKEQTLTATLGERPAGAISEQPKFRRPAFLGVETVPLTAELKKRLNTDAEAGAVVMEVVPNSAAAKAGLKRDDIITALGDRPVKGSRDLSEAIQTSSTDKEVAVQVMRGKEKLSLKANLRETPFGIMPATGIAPTMDPYRRIRELELRVQELEKRLREFEKK